MPFPDPWYFLEIPKLPKDVSDAQIESYNTLVEHLREVANSGCGFVPETFKATMASYMARWHPEITLPRDIV